MAIIKLKDDIYSVGTLDWDRRLFDELIPLPDGTTYNSYFIKGKEKNLLIDTVDPTKKEEFIENLKSLNLEIDYIVSNHAEQDHSGAIPEVLKLWPKAKVVTNEKCKEMLKEHLLIPDDKFMVIKDGEKLSIGGKTFEFIITPWVHWPETMLTYLIEDKILFPCDLFGSHLAQSGLYAQDTARVYFSAKRYYAEIMMPFRNHIVGHIKRLESYKIDIIAPSHGPVYNNPGFILDAYKDWISDTPKKEVIIAYVSMHDSTKKMAQYLSDRLIEKGIELKLFNLTKTDIGELAMALVDASTLVVASPTVLGGPHPGALYSVYLANLLRPKLKFISVIGSYGWGGKMMDVIKNTIGNLKAELIQPVIIKGFPKESDFRALDNLANMILEKNSSL
ncbi:MAG: FprA family A-type flavoprotein [Elusimicrobiota bacterium]